MIKTYDLLLSNKLRGTIILKLFFSKFHVTEMDTISYNKRYIIIHVYEGYIRDVKCPENFEIDLQHTFWLFI